MAAPETTVPRTRAELASCLRDWKYPLIIKSIDSRFRKHKSKTKVFLRSRDEGFELYRQIQDQAIGKLLVQDWIPASPTADWMFNGYFNSHSECTAVFTGRKLRQYPPDVGVTSLGICEYNERVEAIAAQFLESIGYHGAVDIDFRYDERDGEYKLLDVNPRIGGSFRLFVAEDGLDTARILYLDLMGQSVLGVRAREGRKWAVEDYDLVATLAYRKHLTFRDWIKSLKGIQELGFFSLRDPLPTVFMLRSDVTEVLQLLTSAKVPVGPFERNPEISIAEMTLSNSCGSQGEI